MRVAEQLRQAISGSRLVVLPDVGHVCSIEALEAFNREIRAFVSAANADPRRQ